MEYYNAIIEDKHFRDFNPVDFGCESCVPGFEFVSTREFYLIHYVVDGSGTLTIGNSVYEIHAGQIFIIRPGQFTRYRASDVNPWSYIWIGFVGNMSSHFSTLPPTMDFDYNVFTEMLFVKTMESMKEEYLAEKLFQMYRELFQHTSVSEYAAAVKNYIETNYMMNISVDGIAETLNLNRSYLSRIFRRDIGLSIQEYLLDIRISKATKFLSEGFSVQSTANLVGYKDQFVFSKMYKKHTGMSPSKARKKGILKDILK